MLWDTIEASGESIAQEQTTDVVVGGSAVITTAVSVGYVLWMIRGAGLVSSLASSLPAWTLIDPLPILESDKRDEPKKRPKDREQESLQDIAAQEITMDSRPTEGAEGR
jgi:hypothetical protein